VRLGYLPNATFFIKNYYLRLTADDDQPSNYEVRSTVWLGLPRELLSAMTDEEKQEPFAIDESRIERIARGSGVPIEHLESILKNKTTLDLGYYFDNILSGELRIVIWFRLALHEQVKKDFVERPRYGKFKERTGAPAYFAKYSELAQEIVKIASEIYSQYTIRQMPADLVSQIINRLHLEIMSAWSKLD
jgi:hypothetical protein